MEFNPFKKKESGGSLKNPQEPIKSRQEDPLLVRRRVIVKRSSGQIESGFVITAFDHETGEVVVQRPEANRKLTICRIPIAELEEFNPPQK